MSNIWLRRGVFALLNATALAVLGLLLAWPIDALFSDRDASIAQQRALLARFNGIVAQRHAVDALAAKPASDENRKWFLQGPNEGAVTANLQTVLGGMVQAAGARVRSARALPARRDGDLELIGAAIEMTGTIEAVSRTVLAVETAAPVLFIRTASLKPTQVVAMPNRTSAPPTLDAQIEVVGVMLVPEGK